MRHNERFFPSMLIAGVLLLTVAAPRASRGQDCGPFTDMSASDPFCAAVLEIYQLDFTAGISATAFGPTQPLTRQVLAAILARGHRPVAGVRHNRRAALDQFWTTQGTAYDFDYGITAIGAFPTSVVCDGSDVWVASNTAGEVARIRASDGRVLATLVLSNARALLAAMGRIFVTSDTGNSLYEIDPTGPSGPSLVTVLGSLPIGLAFDGSKIWSANAGGSVSIATPGTWTVTPVGGFGQLSGILYDGANIWVTDFDNDKLIKLGQNGGVLQEVAVGDGPWGLAFDGTNLWVSLDAGPVVIVRAATGSIVKTLTGNGLSGAFGTLAYDGERVLVTNYAGLSVSLFRAADFAPLGSYPAIPNLADYPDAVCSNGIDFFLAMHEGRLARF
jgi:hypothetical protein